MTRKHRAVIEYELELEAEAKRIQLDMAERWLYVVRIHKWRWRSTGTSVREIEEWLRNNVEKWGRDDYLIFGFACQDDLFNFTMRWR